MGSLTLSPHDESLHLQWNGGNQRLQGVEGCGGEGMDMIIKSACSILLGFSLILLDIHVYNIEVHRLEHVFYDTDAVGGR